MLLSREPCSGYKIFSDLGWSWQRPSFESVCRSKVEVTTSKGSEQGIFILIP